ncbi:hypothetical protein [Rhizobium mongolense]|uniref:Uncharacterized protein n=2 Tax=Rhizobium mongolense TaxID=57676 RepID=A0ABR6ILW9_9HYPH|nr:hypothetical protein [Rhizobium mongolense]MBB4228878.1 hypothetical protein [Rhizobium mongolense]TVZ63550.1 hypothetical protein BCL32_3703 [Rhizobium mongolense USDA 1844]
MLVEPGYPQPILELETYEHVDFACSLIDPALDSQRDLSDSFHPDLRAFGRGHVFEFIVVLARLLDRVEGLASTGAVKPENLDIATRAVRNWAKGLLEVGEIVRDLQTPVLPGYHHPILREVTNIRYFGRIHRLVKN